ncbi:MAG TPA: hypothetical protein VE623_17120 [Acidimicrobiales bacterium]|nr:hypothetical protein [Acidimicrobiales bacterium]
MLAVAGRWLLVEKPAKNPRKPAGFGVTGRHGDALGERIETGQHGGFVALEEVPVAVEDDGDRRVSGPPGDLLGVGSGGDPQRDGGVAHVVDPEGSEVGRLDGRGPEPAPPRGSPKRPAAGAGEHRRIPAGRGVGRQVVFELSGDGGGDGDGASAGLGLGIAAHDVAVDLDGVLDDPNGAGVEVDLGAAQAGQLAEAQPAVAGHENQRPVSGVDRVGEPGDLDGGQGPHLIALDAGQLDASARRLGQQSGVDGASHHLAERLVGLVDRRGRQSRMAQVGNPLPHVERADGVEAHRPESGEHVVAEVCLVAGP